jgi:hypothetical protein
MIRRLTFLVTCVTTELGATIAPAARPEGALWLAGFASGLVCDLLFAIERQSPKRPLLP